MRLRLGTRGSALALVQANWTKDRLAEAGHEVELVAITTSGDRFSAEPRAAEPSPGDFNKALFVKEIEEALLEGRIDLAVHSAKDLPGELPPGLKIAAYPEREDAGDLLIAPKPLKDLPAGAKVASSALRRQIQLKMLRPDFVVVPVRGNVDTRLRKLAEGQFDGLVLAAAGLRRLGRPEAESGERLDIVSAPGQGALAIEAGKAEVLEALSFLDDPRCRAEVEAERAFLQLVGGGCRTPLGARGEVEGNWMRISVFWSDPEGKKPVRLTARSKTEPAKLQASLVQLAENLRQLASAS